MPFPQSRMPRIPAPAHHGMCRFDQFCNIFVETRKTGGLSSPAAGHRNVRIPPYMQSQLAIDCHSYERPGSKSLTIELLNIEQAASPEVVALEAKIVDRIADRGDALTTSGPAKHAATISGRSNVVRASRCTLEVYRYFRSARVVSALTHQKSPRRSIRCLT